MTKKTSKSEHSGQSVNWDERAKGWKSAALEAGQNISGPTLALIEAAEFRPGQKVLDLACGTGDPIIAIARIIQPGGQAFALDVSQAMLDITRQRAAEQAVSNLELYQGSMETLDFDDQFFDTVTCRFGLMYSKDIASTLDEARRVLKPGGKIAVMVHGPRKNNSQFDIVRRITMEFLNRTEESQLQRFRYSGDGELSKLLADAGFSEIVEKEDKKYTHKNTDENFWQAMLQRQFSVELEQLSTEKLAALDSRIAEAMRAIIVDGKYRLQSSERIATGVV